MNEPVPWLDSRERATWLRLAAMVELLPGTLSQQLERDADLSHFEYYVLAMLSEAPDRTLAMSTLAQRTNATLPRLSHVVRRLENRDLIERSRCATDGRVTMAHLTDAGWDLVVDTAPGHVRHVRALILDALTSEQLDQLHDITEAILDRIDPRGCMVDFYAEPPSGTAETKTA
ncbi:MAG TPA: MarR family transcriptional regulator [Intrasporangium sp.]|nr:MarR family transcriptional regulator [Intrasporangium sp.]